jgi:hypothetical protein
MQDAFAKFSNLGTAQQGWLKQSDLDTMIAGGMIGKQTTGAFGTPGFDISNVEGYDKMNKEQKAAAMKKTEEAYNRLIPAGLIGNYNAMNGINATPGGVNAGAGNINIDQIPVQINMDYGAYQQLGSQGWVKGVGRVANIGR